MDYISEKEFRNQSEKVQKVLLDWWEPQYSDLMGEYNGDFCLVSELMSSSRPKVFKYKYINSKKYVPLFTEGQLRKFIEDKTSRKVQTTVRPSNKYFIDLIGKRYYDEDINITTNEKDVLRTYWIVACKIAEEDKNNE